MEKFTIGRIARVIQHELDKVGFGSVSILHIWKFITALDNVNDDKGLSVEEFPEMMNEEERNDMHSVMMVKSLYLYNEDRNCA